MLKLTPRITIDALTNSLHLTLVVVDAPEGQHEPKIGDVWGVKAAPAHLHVQSIEEALAFYERYRLCVAALPTVEQVEARLRFQFTQAQAALSRRHREANAALATQRRSGVLRA
jgi:hypothetical protein